MSDIAPRPWRLSEWFCADVCAGDEPGTHIMRGLNPSDPTGIDHNSRHAVACVNALHTAGVTPEALARDPGCVAKLVEAAREILVDYEPEHLDAMGTKRAGSSLAAAVRACGIEST